MFFNRATGKFVPVEPKPVIANEKILVLYITNNDRFFVFEKFVDEMKIISCKDKYHMLIVNTNPNDTYTKRLSAAGISSTFATVPCDKSNYLPKIRYGIEYAKREGFKYILKCDNDIIIPAYTLEYMYANRALVDKELTLSPSLSTGIPSVEYFIESMFTADEVDQIRDEFKKCVFHDQPGIFDYRPLNKHSVEASRWDPKAYFNDLAQLSERMVTGPDGRDQYGHSKFYRGMHPIRHGFGNKQINDLIVKNRDKLFAHKECSIIEEQNMYLCDMCFLVGTSNYDQLLNKENLVIDGCDEVPLNRFAWNRSLKHLIIRHGYAIHITYNWRWFLNDTDGGSNIEKPTQTITEFEEEFVTALYDFTPKFDMCIMYLTSNQRQFTFKHVVNAINASKYVGNIHLLVLTHANDCEFYERVLKGSAISYTVKNFDNHDNYMNKVRFTVNFASANKIPYIVKHDNDILMGPAVYDYMFENRGILQDDTNLVLTPTLTSGIPTCDLFVDDYLTSEEKEYMHSLFKSHSFGTIWDVDFQSLNKYTIDANEWSSDDFYKGVHAIDHHYKGIHPVRVNEHALVELNKLVCKYRDQILGPDSYSLTYDTTSPYFCDSIFCVRTDIYANIISSKELFVDAFDEVPLNKWRDIYGRAIVIIRRGTAIHFMYNGIPNYIDYERKFVDMLYA
jgi:hypothetical protein